MCVCVCVCVFASESCCGLAFISLWMPKWLVAQLDRYIYITMYKIKN